jgi:hypothetical protein
MVETDEMTGIKISKTQKELVISPEIIELIKSISSNEIRKEIIRAINENNDIEVSCCGCSRCSCLLSRLFRNCC